MKSIFLLSITAAASLNLNAAEICLDPASDIDADGYGFEQGASCFVVVSGLGPNGEPLSPAAVKSQSVFDPRTAEKIDIKRIKWVVADFADKSFSGCQGYVADPAEESDQCLSCESGETSSYEHYADGNGRLIVENGSVNFEAEFFWSIDMHGFYEGPMPVSAFAEITDTGINQWLEGTPDAIGFYEHCEGLIPSLAAQVVVVDVITDEVATGRGGNNIATVDSSNTIDSGKANNETVNSSESTDSDHANNNGNTITEVLTVEDS